jgi:hypothetical protein
MAAVTTTQFLLAAAKDAVADMRRSDKSDRSQALMALLNANDNDERTTVVVEYGSALVRKALRVAALSAKDEETANVFWLLRDSVDEDGFLDMDESADEDRVLVAA